jgi:hypothetical protein
MASQKELVGGAELLAAAEIEPHHIVGAQHHLVDAERKDKVSEEKREEITHAHTYPHSTTSWMLKDRRHEGNQKGEAKYTNIHISYERTNLHPKEIQRIRLSLSLSLSLSVSLSLSLSLSLIT